MAMDQRFTDHYEFWLERRLEIRTLRDIRVVRKEGCVLIHWLTMQHSNCEML